MTECCNADNGDKKKVNYYIPFLLIPFAVLIYIFLEQGIDFLVFRLLQLDKSAHLTEAIRFFLYDTPKVLILLTVIVLSWELSALIFHRKKQEKHWKGNLCLSAMSWPPHWVSSRHFAPVRPFLFSSVLWKAVFRLELPFLFLSPRR